MGDCERMSSVKYDAESAKMYFEYLRHITTLSTGSIILIATFLEKLFKYPRWKPLVIVSLGGFMVSVLSSVVQYTVMLMTLRKNQVESTKWEILLGLVSLGFTWIGFLIGIISLAIFAIRNLI